MAGQNARHGTRHQALLRSNEMNVKIFTEGNGKKKIWFVIIAFGCILSLLVFLGCRPETGPITWTSAVSTVPVPESVMPNGVELLSGIVCLNTSIVILAVFVMVHVVSRPGFMVRLSQVLSVSSQPACGVSSTDVTVPGLRVNVAMPLLPVSVSVSLPTTSAVSGLTKMLKTVPVSLVGSVILVTLRVPC